jgi:hypothetical protein
MYFPPITIEGKEFFDKGTTFQNLHWVLFLKQSKWVVRIRAL